MCENYKEHEDFRPTYDDEPQLPIPVAVFGVGDNDPFLGIGMLIGSIEVTGLGEPLNMPVIEIIDTKDGQPYTILGWDCSKFTPEIPDEILDGMEQGTLLVQSVSEYLEASEMKATVAEIADASWLDESGIDPSSL